ncbi:MAG: hypothetical protein BWZ10_00300 [candidate division BRC1 bacterium ADurb.BinA364]|nr:MAG: hypothetical protein BWZ10_00300 [candidate division BRC1 bacterium ADurb.BinA364]
MDKRIFRKRGKKSMVTKSAVTTRAIVNQAIGYAVLLFLIIGDELFDFPHTVFGAAATPINWTETFIECMYVLLLGSFSLIASYRYLARIKFLEGFIPICSYCKKIRHDGEWIALEQYIDDHSEAVFSHGLCPECEQKHFRE